MNNQPSTLELLQAIRNFISEIAMPELEGRAAFHARVAVNVVDTLMREQERRPAAENEYKIALTSLLGSEGDLPTLKQKLCDQIRNGEIALDAPGLLEILKRATIAQVEIDQPHYSGLKIAKEARGD